MSQYLRIVVFISFLCVFLLSCKKNSLTIQSPGATNNPVSLTGKLKKLSWTNTSLGYTFSFDFKYDTLDGKLNSILANNREFCHIYKEMNNSIRLIFDLNAMMSEVDSQYTFISRAEYYAYLDHGYIDKITSIDTVTHREKMIAVYYRNGILLDSMVGSFPSGASNYIFNNDNLEQLYNFIGIAYPIGGISSTLQFHYASLLNTGTTTPLQHFEFYFPTSFVGTDVTYFLGLNGYYPYRPNKNLVDTIYSVEFSGPVATMYNEYELNNQMRVSKMTNKTIQTFGEENAYEMEYY
ncbi:MAG: hypothetical protein JWN78_310 [Bacteroidota bacterium]|nr:hypothetical protein [Bacteroidota bacterium]